MIGLVCIVFVAIVAAVLIASIVLLIVGRNRFPKWARILLIILLVVSAVILALVALVVIFMGRAHPSALPVQY